MEALLLEALKDGKPLELIKSIIFFIVAWHMVKKEMRLQISTLATAITDMGTALNTRIDMLEKDMLELKKERNSNGKQL